MTDSTDLEHGESVSTSSEWKYQIRIQLSDEVAASARTHEELPILRPLYDLLELHDARLICQYDAFAGYCKEAERVGNRDLPLYKWTKATIEDPVKQKKYVKIFTIYVKDQEVYEKEVADTLESALQELENRSIIEKLSKYDSNPANNPQPPKKYQS